MVSVLLACLWGLHAAAPNVPGRLDIRLPLLMVLVVGLFMIRARSRRQVPFSKNGLVGGLCCWLIGATLSAVLNWRLRYVLSMYLLVFVCGAFVYAALSGLVLSPRNLDFSIVGLVIGSLFPLLIGLQAFGTEFGPTDATSFVGAYSNRLRMVSYEIATFGNRGNTAAFLLIIAPIFLAVLLDAKRHWSLRALCGLSMVPVLLNFLIIQVRAGFIMLLASVIVVLWFRYGTRRLPLFAAVLVSAWLLAFSIEPDAGWMIRDRIVAAITLDTEGDTSVQGRAEALQEAIGITGRHWLLGVGPGGGPSVHSRDTAHQFQIHQAMETGIFGLVGSAMFTLGVWICLVRTMARGPRDDTNNMRFVLLVGPAVYVTYSVIVNAALNASNVNTWAILVASMLALMPPFEPKHVRRII